MTIDSKSYRVPPDKKVDLSKWPTIVAPYSKSKKQYEELLHRPRRRQRERTAHRFPNRP
jgi:hypothetical protein